MAKFGTSIRWRERSCVPCPLLVTVTFLNSTCPLLGTESSSVTSTGPAFHSIRSTGTCSMVRHSMVASESGVAAYAVPSTLTVSADLSKPRSGWKSSVLHFRANRSASMSVSPRNVGFRSADRSGAYWTMAMISPFPSGKYSTPEM